jgi:Uma2 family endonuclease
MSEAGAPKGWSWEAYLAWEARQPVRHELVDGQPRAMGGGTAEHDTIANNLRAELRARLRGGPCRPQGPDLKVRAGANARYPDALIDCGPRVPGATHAMDPVAVFEVLSRSTGWIDQSLKLRDYDAMPGIRHYVLINQDEPRALVYQRDASGRLGIGSAVLLEGMEAVIEIPALDLAIPFAALYEGLEFTPPPEGPADRVPPSPAA